MTKPTLPLPPTSQLEQQRLYRALLLAEVRGWWGLPPPHSVFNRCTHPHNTVAAVAYAQASRRAHSWPTEKAARLPLVIGCLEEHVQSGRDDPTPTLARQLQARLQKIHTNKGI